MNDRQLKSFLMTADHKSFAKAASASYISTSALISQISLLERDTGLTLFRRNPRGIELTKEGEVFYGYAKKMLQLYEEALQVASMAGSEEQNRITILGRDLNFTHPFKLFCIDYTEQNPDVKIVFGERSINELYDSFMQNPAAVLGSSRFKTAYEADLEFLNLYNDQLLVLVPEGHPLRRKEVLQPKDLAGYHVLCEKIPLIRLDYEELFGDIPGINLEYCEPFHSELPIMNAFSANQLVLRPKRWSCFALDVIKGVPIQVDLDMSVGIYYHKDCPKYVMDFLEACRDH